MNPLIKNKENMPDCGFESALNSRLILELQLVCLSMPQSIGRGTDCGSWVCYLSFFLLLPSPHCLTKLQSGDWKGDAHHYREHLSYVPVRWVNMPTASQENTCLTNILLNITWGTRHIYCHFLKPKSYRTRTMFGSFMLHLFGNCSVDDELRSEAAL